MERKRSIIGKCKVKVTDNGDILLGFVCVECLTDLVIDNGKLGKDGKHYVDIFIKKFKSNLEDKYGNTHTIDVNIKQHESND